MTIRASVSASLVRVAAESGRVASTALVTRLRDEHGVLIVPGDHFGMDGYLRIGFGNEPADLRAGLARIDAGITGLRKGRVREA